MWNNSIFRLKPDVVLVVSYNFWRKIFIFHGAVALTAASWSFSEKIGPMMLLDQNPHQRSLDLVLSASPRSRTGFLSQKCDNFTCWHSRKDGNLLRTHFFVIFQKWHNFQGSNLTFSNIAQPYNQPFSSTTLNILNFCQRKNDINVTRGKIAGTRNLKSFVNHAVFSKQCVRQSSNAWLTSLELIVDVNGLTHLGPPTAYPIRNAHFTTLKMFTVIR